MYHFELTRPQRRNSWEKELEKFFDVFSKEDYYAPACEIVDEDKSYLVSLDIPGLKQDEIDIEVKDNHLYISGERKMSETTKKESYLRSERRYGKFSRVFSLPQNVNADKIEAKFENGVLDVVLPKEEKSTTKKIKISSFPNETTSQH